MKVVLIKTPKFLSVLLRVLFKIDKVQEEASKKNVSFDYELSFLISHGILHLLGFDHQTEEDYNFIIELQNKALESIGIKKE